MTITPGQPMDASLLTRLSSRDRESLQMIAETNGTSLSEEARISFQNRISEYTSRMRAKNNAPGIDMGALTDEQIDDQAFADVGAEMFGDDGTERYRDPISLGDRRTTADSSEFWQAMEAQIRKDNKTLERSAFGVLVAERRDMILAQNPTMPLVNADAQATSAVERDHPEEAQKWWRLSMELSEARRAMEEKFFATGFVESKRLAANPPGDPSSANRKRPTATVKGLSVSSDTRRKLGLEKFATATEVFRLSPRGDSRAEKAFAKAVQKFKDSQ